jgi:hypothetical protein
MLTNFGIRHPHPLVVVPETDGALEVLYPTSNEDFEELKRRYPQHGLTFTTNVRAPDTDTGR